MKLFKTIDEKFADIGFVKIKEDRYGASYEREDPKHIYTQRLNLVHKLNGEWFVQSYEKDVNSDGFNNSVGLTPYEMELGLKKIKKLEQAAGNDMACYL